MSIGILLRNYISELRPAETSEILFGCIGERLSVQTKIYYEQATIMSEDNNKGYFNPDPIVSGKIYNDDLWWIEDGDFFNQCQVGDEIVFRSEGYPGDPDNVDTIVEILSGGLARMATPRAYRLLLGGFVYNNTALKSLTYQYGLGIGGFNSQVDDSLQKYILNNIASLSGISITAADAVGYNDWQFRTEELYVTGAGQTPSVASQAILIYHSFIVGPLFLAGQYDDLRAGIPPDYFLPDNKIRYSSIVDYNKSSVIADTTNELAFEDVGQFGWFNKKYNGSAPGYKINSVVLTRESDSVIIPQLEYGRIIIEIEVESLGGDFDVSDNGMVFGFNYLPENESLYQKTDRTIEQNFCFDSKFFNLNSTDVNGNKFGTSNQVIDVIRGHISAPKICQVRAVIDFGSDILQTLHQADTARYAIWIISEQNTLEPELSDKTSLLVQVNEIHVQKTKIDLFDATVKFIEHPYDDINNGVNTIEMFPADDIVAQTILKLDYTGLEDDGIIIKSVAPSIVLTHATEADITLDSYFISTENYPLIGSLPTVQDINFAADRPYKIENGIRKTITFIRDYDGDSGLIKSFILSFPFMNRWEYWIKVMGLTSIPASIFDNTVPFGGANHLWDRLINSAGWSLQYRTTIGILQNGEDFEQVFDTELTSNYFESNPEWTLNTIKSYDLDNNVQIAVGSKNFVYAAKNTLIRASFSKTIGDVPAVNKVCIVLWAEGFEGAGISEIRNISSARDVISLSCWKSVNGSNRTKIVKNMQVFTGEAILDFSKLPQGQEITVYARIYEIESDVEEVYRITQDNQIRILMDNDTPRIV